LTVSIVHSTNYRKLIASTGVTTNTVSVPTVQAEKCTVSVNGQVELALLYEISVQNKVLSSRTKMSISWAANIVLHPHLSGLRVELTPPEVKPQFTMDEIKCMDSGKTDNILDVDVEDAARFKWTCKEVFDELQREFPSAINLSEIVSNLSRSLQGCWTGLELTSNGLAATKLSFNEQGDFVAEWGF